MPGHAFGLVHCDFCGCVMHASSTVDEVDVTGTAFCGHRAPEALDRRAVFVPSRHSHSR